ncbi:MAG: protein-L-isoaspartate(D-aspartate) O-methyltransferase [Candidatus Hydrogenedentota bacterium]
MKDESESDSPAAAREAMVRKTIIRRGITNPDLLAALRRVPRHEMVPAAQRAYAYEDCPLPIGFDQTISQPYIVASMTELAGVHAGSRVLELGTGSGYQAAILAALGCEVETFEIIEPLAAEAERALKRLGYGDRVRVHHGDGYHGLPARAPFDAVIATAAPEFIPEPLVEQLAMGGRLVIPVGRVIQDLIVVEKTEAGRIVKSAYAVRFVPMTGAALRQQAKN